MKIALVGPVYPYRGGIAHHTHFLDNALQELEHSTEVISFRRQYPAWLYPGQTDKDPSLKERPSNASYLLDPFYPWTWRQAAQQIFSSKPDLVVIEWWTTFWSIPFAYLARRFKSRRIPTIFLIHNVLPHEPRLWDAWLARQALRSATAFLAQTEQEQTRLLALFPDAKVHVYPHPAYQISNQNLSKAEARKQLEIPDSLPVLLFFGFVRAYKGLHHLIEAMGILRSRGIQPHLLIAGEFWEDKAEYVYQIEALSITDQVHLFDRYIPDEEVGRFFAAADLLVAPYIHGATQSGAANIARGLGLPMVISDIVQDGLDQVEPDLVRVVPAGDSAALASAIHSFLESYPRSTPRPVSVQDEWQLFAQNLLGIIR